MFSVIVTLFDFVLVFKLGIVLGAAPSDTRFDVPTENLLSSAVARLTGVPWIFSPMRGPKILVEFGDLRRRNGLLA